MNKPEIIQKLANNHKAFVDLMASLSREEFEHQNGEKWTPGQQLDHIRLSVKPLVKGLSMPSETLTAMFGEANRPSKSFDGVVSKYHSKLKEGARATTGFIPDPIAWAQKDELVEALQQLTSQLCSQVEGYSEKDLDRLIMPHPLLGKLTLREMFYFTFYHVQHHHIRTLENLGRPSHV